jgi:hypothetical protein
MDLGDARRAPVHVRLKDPVVEAALELLRTRAVSAAIVDHGLGTDSSEAVCQFLADHGIPFVNYGAFTDLQGARKSGATIPKPSTTSPPSSTLDQGDQIKVNRVTRGGHVEPLR